MHASIYWKQNEKKKQKRVEKEWEGERRENVLYKLLRHMWLYRNIVELVYLTQFWHWCWNLLKICEFCRLWNKKKLSKHKWRIAASKTRLFNPRSVQRLYQKSSHRIVVHSADIQRVNHNSYMKFAATLCSLRSDEGLSGKRKLFT